MQRIVSTILLCFYLVAAVGATFHIHSCMGEVTDSRLGHTTSSVTCSHCGMPLAAGDSEGCCKDVHQQLRLSGEQQREDAVVVLAPMPVPLPLTRLLTAIVIAPLPVVKPPVADIVVPGRVPLFIRHCTYLI